MIKKIEILTEEINLGLVIKSVKNLKFGNEKVFYILDSGFALYHPVLGFVCFKYSKDQYGLLQPYLPVGGKKVLESILNNGGFLSYDDIDFIKPL